MSVRIKTIAKLLEAARYRHDLYTTFSDCMEAMAISMANAVDLTPRPLTGLVLFWTRSAWLRSRPDNPCCNFPCSEPR